ncbi:MAG: SMP-30/gluconolactonase/LRE family protein [Sneathiella sp.]
MQNQKQQQPLIPLEAVTFIGHDLNRPESVHVGEDGSLYVSHRDCGVSQIKPNGQQHLIGKPGQLANGHELIPNGIARMPDGSFRIANIGDGGGVWTLDEATGAIEPFIMEADGCFLAAANFVMTDPQGRTWITVSTVSQPRFAAYNEDVADGLIVLHDEHGTRIVADGIGFANECRLSADGKRLVVAETFARRITQFDLMANGDLKNTRTFAQFGRGDFPDGCRFDQAGHLWMTSIVSNRLYRIAPDGTSVLILEDTDPNHVDWVENALAAGKMGREHFYETGGEKLRNIASVAFGGNNGRTVYLGSLANTKIATFTLPETLQ